MSDTIEPSTTTIVEFPQFGKFTEDIQRVVLAQFDDWHAQTRQQTLINFARCSRECESLAQNELRRTLLLTEDRFRRLCQDLSEALTKNEKREEVLKDLDHVRHIVVPDHLEESDMDDADKILVQLGEMEEGSASNGLAVFKRLKRVTYTSNVSGHADYSEFPLVPAPNSEDRTVNIFPTALKNHWVSVCTWRPLDHNFRLSRLDSEDNEHNSRNLTLHITRQDLSRSQPVLPRSVEDGFTSRRIIASQTNAECKGPESTTMTMSTACLVYAMSLLGSSCRLELVDFHKVFDARQNQEFKHRVDENDEYSKGLPSWRLLQRYLERTGVRDQVQFTFTEDEDTNHCEACGPWSSSPGRARGARLTRIPNTSESRRVHL